ncbi:hypothetical protein B0H14DRAFT_3712091 [Mycena olivaceomarginata]|nr:hypothetical protein B0H14DRAFT_3712091 [Mycena olivaceomarginata]
MGLGGLVVAKRKSELVVEEEEKSEHINWKKFSGPEDWQLNCDPKSICGRAERQIAEITRVPKGQQRLGGGRENFKRTVEVGENGFKGIVRINARLIGWRRPDDQLQTAKGEKYLALHALSVGYPNERAGLRVRVLQSNCQFHPTPHFNFAETKEKSRIGVDRQLHHTEGLERIDVRLGYLDPRHGTAAHTPRPDHVDDGDVELETRYLQILQPREERGDGQAR